MPGTPWVWQNPTTPKHVSAILKLSWLRKSCAPNCWRVARHKGGTLQAWYKKTGPFLYIIVGKQRVVSNLYFCYRWLWKATLLWQWWFQGGPTNGFSAQRHFPLYLPPSAAVAANALQQWGSFQRRFIGLCPLWSCVDHHYPELQMGTSLKLFKKVIAIPRYQYITKPIAGLQKEGSEPPFIKARGGNGCHRGKENGHRAGKTGEISTFWSAQ